MVSPAGTMTTLHYIYDPLFGWCYGAAPLMHALLDLADLRIVLHGGGLMAGAARRPVTPQLRAFVLPHDRRIAELSGQPFAAGYTEGLLNDTGAVLDSGPPITALLAAQSLGSDPVHAGVLGIDLLERIQQAHYVEGRRVASAEVLLQLATELNFDAAAFGAAFERLAGPATDSHIEESRQLLQRVARQGFPTVAIEGPDGRLSRVEIGQYYGQAQRWVEAVQRVIERQP